MMLCHFFNHWNIKQQGDLLLFEGEIDAAAIYGRFLADYRKGQGGKPNLI